MYQFFAIVEVEGTREPRRVPLEGDLQAAVSEELEGQVDRLLPEDVEIIAYDPGYKPDDEVLSLPNYPLPPYVKEAWMVGDALPVLATDELIEGNVKALFGIALSGNPNPPLMAFQNFDAGQVLHRGFRFLLLDRETFQRSDRTGLKIGSKVSAVLRDGDLLFQSEFLVRRYLELDTFFRDATDEEIGDLLSHTAFAPSDRAAFIDHADRWIRRKTTSIVERGILDEVPVDKIVQIGREFELTVQTTTIDGQAKIVIPEDKQAIKRLLRLLDDDLLDSPLTDAKYQVSSKRKI